ncbi:hypothetical protein QCA50_018042 [Cerrena zonata]|uniref:Uncharacterized protein n=1 Tax=Cerrena zonata TaxID=2478898 RepID=A0AAW0FHU1_9APHY
MSREILLCATTVFNRARKFLDTPRAESALNTQFTAKSLNSVFQTSVDISQPLQDAFLHAWDVQNPQDLDDAEGCPLEQDDTHGVDLSEDDHHTPTYSPGESIDSATDGRSIASTADGGSITSTASGSSLTKQDARKRAYRRKKKQKTRERNREKPGHHLFSPKFKIRLALSQKLSNLAFIRSNSNVADLPAATGAWVGVRGAVGRGLRSLHSLLEEGYEYKAWDGITPFVVTGQEDRIFIIFAGRPQDPTYEDDSLLADAILQDTHNKLQFGSGNCQVLPRVSYGGGQKAPGNLCHTKHNQEVLNHFFQQQSLRFCSCLWQHNRHLKHNVPRNIFPATSINFGPVAVSCDHLYHNNLAGGLCSITAGGDFDPTKGGHIYLVNLRLVVEFPPGATILIPSSVIRHGNVPIQTGEIRTSFTQHAAGGLFRWVEYGFKTWDQFWETDRERALKDLENRSRKWMDYLGLFSKVSELERDHAAVRNGSST